MNRNQLYGLVHKGAGIALQLGKLEAQSADQVYRDFLQDKLGVRSCKDATTAQLESLINEFKTKGVLPDTQRNIMRQGGSGTNRPTERQYAKLAALTRQMEWSGLEDERLVRFVKRTAKVDGLRFLSRKKMSDLIAGLESWVNGR